jgi:hypothetical protein
MIRLELLHDVHRAAFEELLRETWQQNWDAELARQIVQWRYYDRPGDAMTWIALEQDRCVAMLDSMLRPYMMDGQRITVRETADWYCTPRRRPFGIGLWLLQQVYSFPEPVFVLGGSQVTLDLLTKLKWKSLPAAKSYVLPIKVRGLMANVIRQRWWQHEAMARTIPSFLPLKRPKRVAPPTDRFKVRKLSSDDSIAMADAAQTGLVELLETEHWQWLARMPTELAMPVGLLFSFDDKPIAVSYSQIEPAASGLDARIVHLQFTDPSIGAWVISTTARMLADYGVGFVRCCVSTDDKIAAIEKVGFVKTKDIPCHWLPRMADTPTCIDVGYLRGDDAMPFQALRGRVGRAP